MSDGQTVLWADEADETDETEETEETAEREAAAKAPAVAAGGAEPARTGRSSRRKRPVRAKTIAIKQMRKEELRLGALLYPERDYWRPRTRAECRDAPRPCPFVGCKHHLFLDVSKGGGIKFNFPDLEVWELVETCALDVAERSGGVTLEEVGAIMNLTRERIRQLEAVGIERIEAAGLLEMMEGVRAACGSCRGAEAAADAPAAPAARPRPPRRVAAEAPAAEGEAPGEIRRVAGREG
jgi:hypothetical protein